MSDQLRNNRKLIKHIEAIRKAPAPQDLKDIIIHRITCGEEESIHDHPAMPFVQKIRQIFPSPTKEECAISFISMGFFYLILGGLIWMSVNRVPDSPMHDWLQLQSPIFMLIAVLLIAIGAMVWIRGSQAVKIANWGLLVYILLFIIAGVMTFPEEKMQIILGGILCIGAILTGASLHLFVDKYAYQASMKKEVS